jgi:hypothetical protein
MTEKITIPNIFQKGKGVNCLKINDNFGVLKNMINILIDAINNLNVKIDEQSKLFPKKEPGSLAYMIRTDSPENYMRCDGFRYSSINYRNFVKNYLLEGKIPFLSVDNWEEQEEANDGNCCCFGYDAIENILIAPKFNDSVAIMQALIAGNIGKFNKEGLPNITGSTFGDIGAFRNPAEGCLSLDNLTPGRSSSSSGSGYSKLFFDASRSNPIYGNSEHVTPRHIQCPLFVYAEIDP